MLSEIYRLLGIFCLLFTFGGPVDIRCVHLVHTVDRWTINTVVSICLRSASDLESKMDKIRLHDVNKQKWMPLSPAFSAILAAILVCLASDPAAAVPFVHPGLLQTRQQLDFMKQMVADGKEPWKSAWKNLCAGHLSSLDFQPKPIAHIIRGSYGVPGIGDHDLMDSANAAYSQAIQWYITGDPVHAQKAEAIINAWSGTLQDFKGNDAKLLAGWTGHVFCNAAEILRNTDSGWPDHDVQQFKQMLLTVYYPLIRDYFPAANGNWDAAMMDTTLCIGIFCDDHEIFDRTVEHFLRGPGNSGITKYIYPSGQCEETTRDQGHTQLGLGELVQTCAVAWNQGVDLFGAADNRLALGLEYTAKYVSGHDVPAYGTPSVQTRGRLSDIYEAVYQHYHEEEGFSLPFTGQAVTRTRAGRAWGALVFFRGAPAAIPAPRVLVSSTIAAGAGALQTPSVAPGKVIRVKAGDSVQRALDACGADGTVSLDPGVFRLSGPLRIPSGVTLAGQGPGTTVMLDAGLSGPAVTGVHELHDVTLRDFVIEGGTNIPGFETARIGWGNGPRHADPNAYRQGRSSPLAPSRGGIDFESVSSGQIHNVRLMHLTVRDCTLDGVALRGATEVTIDGCDFSNNGASVPPGPGQLNDLVLNHVSRCQIEASRLDDSLRGSGILMTNSDDITITNCECARNARHGIHLVDSHNVMVSGNLVEGNDRDGVLAETQSEPCRNIQTVSNIVRNNGGPGVWLEGAVDAGEHNNSMAENGSIR